MSEPKQDYPEMYRYWKLTGEGGAKYAKANIDAGNLSYDITRALIFMATPEHSNWLSIDSAPKDGRHFLVVDEKGVVFEAHFEKFDEKPAIVKTKNKNLAFAIYWTPMPTPPTSQRETYI